MDWVRIIGAFLGLLWLFCTACSDDGGECSTRDDCDDGMICVDGICRPEATDGDADTDGDTDSDVDADTDADGDSDGDEDEEPCDVPCDDECCASGERCYLGGCIPNNGTCEDGVCQNDTFCVDGVCVPFGVGPVDEFDPECAREIEPLEDFQVEVQCRWTGPPDGDAHPEYRQVIGTPAVVDLGIEGEDGTSVTSIIFVSYRWLARGDPMDGIIRVIDGSTCEEQVAATDEDLRVFAGAPPAVGDLNLDG